MTFQGRLPLPGLTCNPSWFRKQVVLELRDGLAVSGVLELRAHATFLAHIVTQLAHIKRAHLRRELIKMIVLRL